MPISFFWSDDSKTVLVEKIEGKWTLADWQQLIDAVAIEIAAVAHTVHVIVDAADSAPPPAQMLAIVQYAIEKMPANQGLTLFVGLTRLMKMFMDFGKQISPQVTRYAYAVDNLEAAYQLIAEKAHLFNSKT